MDENFYCNEDMEYLINMIRMNEKFLDKSVTVA